MSEEIQTVQVESASLAIRTNIPSVTTEVVISASGAGRKGMSVYNDSSSVMYLALGKGVTTTSFTILVAPAGYYELPGPNFFRGDVTAVWASANGFARVTELY